MNLKQIDTKIQELINSERSLSKELESIFTKSIETEDIKFFSSIDWSFSLLKWEEVILDWNLKVEVVTEFLVSDLYLESFLQYFFWKISWDKFWREVFWKVKDDELEKLFRVAQTKDKFQLKKILEWYFTKWLKTFQVNKLRKEKELKTIQNELSSLQNTRLNNFWTYYTEEVNEWNFDNFKEVEASNISKKSEESEKSKTSEKSDYSEKSKKADSSTYSERSEEAKRAEESIYSSSSWRAATADVALSVDEEFLKKAFKNMPKKLEEDATKRKVENLFTETDKKKMEESKKSLSDIIDDLKTDENTSDEVKEFVEDITDNSKLSLWEIQQLNEEASFQYRDISTSLENLEEEKEEVSFFIVRVWHIVTVVMFFWIATLILYKLLF